MKEEKGVSMMVEYLILMGILSIFVVVTSLVLEDTLKSSQVAKVVDNQFSDVASQISAQIVDMAALYPSNGYLKAKVYMPTAIGDIEYTVGFEEIGGKRFIYITSDRGEFKKYLSLGAFASLRFENMSGITHSLREKHELYFLSAQIIYPTAVLKVKPSSIIAGQNVTIDVSNSYSPSDWWWVVYKWDGSELTRGDMGTLTKNIKILWSNDIPARCRNYNSTTESAICTLTLVVYDSRGYTANDTEEILIAKKVGVEPELYIKKYLTPEVIQVGQPFELHLRLVGRGFVVEETRQNLTVVTVLDKSGSMHAGSVSEAHSERTKFGEDFQYPLSPRVWNVSFGVSKDKPTYIVVYTTQSMPYWNSSATSNIPSDISPDDAFTLYINGAEISKTLDRSSTRAPSYGGINFACSGGELVNTNGVCYEATPSNTGTWNASIVVANPDNLTVNIVVFERPSASNYNYNRIFNQSYTYTPNLVRHSFRFEPGFTSNDRYEFAYVFIPKSYADKLNAWIYNTTAGRFAYCRDYSSPVAGKVCFVQRVPAGQDIPIYIVPRKMDANKVEGTLWMEKLDAAKIAAIKFINESLNETDYKGLVEFSTCAYTYEVNATSLYLKKLTKQKSVVINHIKNIVPTGWTNYLEALEHAKNVLLENTTIINGTKPLIILLSDGMPTCKLGSYTSDFFSCGSNRYRCSDTVCSPDDCGSQVIPKANEVKNMRIGNEYIDICTIGFGEKSYYNETILKAVSGRHTGNGVVECYYSAETLEELIEAFQSIGRLYRVAATNVRLIDPIPINLSLYMYPNLEPTLNIEGSAKCDPLNLNFTASGTIINLNCSEIHIDDVIEIVITLVAYETGVVPINLGGKVNFIDINGKQREIPLPYMVAEIKSSKGAEVKIS
ncbi:MAG: VWA domain-containing protein [Archaeoglobaceae archaeon]|nr:VWA domain-containing protein [Archaeoglobaceae archaeon]MDW8117896.1 vWA domain-containing protein [Archaeoglobaceae archaeon]